MKADVMCASPVGIQNAVDKKQFCDNRRSMRRTHQVKRRRDKK